MDPSIQRNRSVIPLAVTRTPLIIAIIAAIVLQPVSGVLAGAGYGDCTGRGGGDLAVGVQESGIFCSGCKQCRISDPKRQCGCCSGSKASAKKLTPAEPVVQIEVKHEPPAARSCCSKRASVALGQKLAENQTGTVTGVQLPTIKSGSVVAFVQQQVSESAEPSKVDSGCGCRLEQSPMVPTKSHSAEPRQIQTESFLGTVALAHCFNSDWRARQTNERFEVPVRPDRFAQRFLSVWLN